MITINQIPQPVINRDVHSAFKYLPVFINDVKVGELYEWGNGDITASSWYDKCYNDDKEYSENKDQSLFCNSEEECLDFLRKRTLVHINSLLNDQPTLF